MLPPSEYHPLITRWLEVRPTSLVLLATDSPTFLNEMRVRYNGRLVTYEAMRSHRNAFADPSLPHNYKKGEDALVDSLLLSCANFIIKPASALSEFSVCTIAAQVAFHFLHYTRARQVYFNLELHNHTIELQYEVGRPDTAAAMAFHFASSRDAARGLQRCAPAMWTEPYLSHLSG